MSGNHFPEMCIRDSINTMTEKMNQLMKDVPAIRWTALILLASAMFFGYIFMDILSPLQELLQTSRGWSPDAYGHYAGSETFLNVFVFFLIFAGIILDKMGVRFTAIPVSYTHLDVYKRQKHGYSRSNIG